jgi:hypothetical protein
LIEASSTNSLTYSSKFDQSPNWAPTTCTVNPNVVTAPDNTLTGYELISTAGGGRVVSQNVTATATTVTFSAFLKVDGTDNGARLLVYNGTTSTTIGTNSLSAITSGTPYANGWYRHSVTVTTGITVGNTLNFYIYTDQFGGTNGTKLYAWGAQAEFGISFPTSYIPTTAATVTRGTDVAVVSGTNFSSWFSSTAGTFYAEGAPITSTPTPYSFLAEGYTGSLAGTFTIGTGGSTTTFGLDARIGGASNNTNESIATTYTAGGTIKASVSYDSTPSAGLVLNGAVVTASSISTAATATSLYIGSRSGTTNLWNGWVRRIAFFNSKLPNATMQTLTT